MYAGGMTLNEWLEYNQKRKNMSKKYAIRSWVHVGVWGYCVLVSLVRREKNMNRVLLELGNLRSIS